MENASKALLIAAGVLIGIMVLSVGVHIFKNLSNSSKTISEEIYDNQLAQFNNQFTKYLGREDITAHEIVSVCNLARDNNRKYYGENWETDIGYGTISYNSSNDRYPYYVAVWFKSTGNTSHQIKFNPTTWTTELDHMEQLNVGFSDRHYPELYKNILKYNDVDGTTHEKIMFSCRGIIYNELTGRVVEITFTR